MPRTGKTANLEAIDARRQALRGELAALDEQAKAAEEAARDAGRPVLMAALARIKIGALAKADARRIAAAIAQHGGMAVASQLAALG